MNFVTRLTGSLARRLPQSVVFAMYTNWGLAGPVRRLLNMATPDGDTEVQVARGPLAGTRLVVDLRSEKYLWLGTYEPWVQDTLCRLVTDDATVWDVGAFVGYHTLLMAKLTRGSVVALEPDPDNRTRLEHHIALNAAMNVHVLPVAVGSEAGWGRSERLTEDNRGATRIEPGQGPCRIVTMDHLLETQPAPRLVKVDIEGAEDQAFAGAQRLINEVRPIWLLETHGRSGRSAVVALQEAGYEITSLGKGVTVRPDLPVGGPGHVVAMP